jgi:hypothetical protein
VAIFQNDIAENDFDILPVSVFLRILHVLEFKKLGQLFIDKLVDVSTKWECIATTLLTSLISSIICWDTSTP